jgi:3-hexulose-6-phosphate synthase/6-phospho-3-hexuloisomerase
MKLVDGAEPSPVSGTLEAIRAGRPGDVLVIDHAGRHDVNSWGGISTFAARKRGIAGVVIDGVTRDLDEIREQKFPAYGRGVIQQSVRGRCAFGGHGVEVRVAGVMVWPGDLVMGDENGIVIVPQDHIGNVLKIAEECARTEEKIKRAIARGVDPVEAHAKEKY